ncbi:MAG: BatA domain-containing protein, partial [Chthoniobacteraceae bacterium]|nr:BatA domain-containing protein [Chthoniobacteraceae bacterium]
AVTSLSAAWWGGNDKIVNFLNPAVLFGMAGISIPIAIHLISKFRVKHIHWAAMRFLQESVQRTRRRLQYEDLLLLALRCLFFAALVAAFARPVQTSPVSGESDTQGPLAVVVLLDNSASMAQSDGVETRFESAKKAIRDWLGASSKDRLLALYTVSNRADALIGKPVTGVSMFQRALSIAQVSEHGSDLLPGIRAAYQALASVSGRAREIRIYTDSQTAAWSRLDEIRKLQKENPGIRLKPVLIGKAGEENLGITALQQDSGVPAVNQPSRFRVDVKNFGTQPAQRVRVVLATDGGAASDEALIARIEPGETQSANLFARFTSPGYHGVSAAIPPDRMPLDNERSAVVAVASRMNALIVEGSGAPAKVDRDGYFLANALVPLARAQAAQNYLKITALSQAALSNQHLESSDLLFLCNPGTFAEPAARDVREFVQKGGRLVIFPGSKTDPAQWNRKPRLGDLLPATLGPAKTPGAGTPPLTWPSGGFEHPVTAIWNDPGLGGLTSVCFTGYFPLTLKSPTAAANDGNAPQVMVRYANGEPSAVERHYGRGIVVLFGSTATPQWNNLPLHPAFVPFVQRLLGYLDPQRGRRLALAPGERFEAAVPMDCVGKEFSVVRPGKDPARRVAGVVEAADGQAFIRYAETEAPGVYRLYLGESVAPTSAFAIQLDPAESDLRQADEKEVQSLSAAGVEGGATNPPAGSWETRFVVTREYWISLLWVAAALGLVEMMLAHRFSQSK